MIIDRPLPLPLNRNEQEESFLISEYVDLYNDMKIQNLPISGSLMYFNCLHHSQQLDFYGWRGFEKYPDLQLLSEKIAKELNICWDYRLDLIESNEFAGETNGAFDVIIEFDFRKNFPYTWRVATDNFMRTFYNQRSMFMFLLAHEFCHCTTGHPENFVRNDGSIDIMKCELFCNQMAMEITNRLGGRCEYV